MSALEVHYWAILGHIGTVLSAQLIPRTLKMGVNERES